MEKLDAMIEMGGYAAFVWPAYAIVLSGLIGAVVVSVRGWKAREREFESLKALRLGKENP